MADRPTSIYAILQANESDDLMVMVNKAKCEGWREQGGVSVAIGYDHNSNNFDAWQRIWAQAMVKDVEPE